MGHFFRWLVDQHVSKRITDCSVVSWPSSGVQGCVEVGGGQSTVSVINQKFVC